MSTKLRHLISYFLTFFIVAVSAFEGFTQDRYWVNGTGLWNDTNHWAEVSGGKPGASIPTEVNNVIFDDNSFTSNDQEIIVKDLIKCNDFIWQVNNYKPTLKSSSFLFKSLTKAEINISGSLLMNENINNSFFGDIVLKASDEEKINSKAKLNSDLIVDSKSGKYQLDNSFSSTGNIIIKSGKLYTNDNNIYVKEFISRGSEERTLDLGKSDIFIDNWDFEESRNINFKGENSTLNFRDDYTKKGFKPGDLKYNAIQKAGAKSNFTYNITITDVTCNGAENGQIQVDVTSGGVSPFTFILQDADLNTLESYKAPIGVTTYTFNPVAYDPGVPGGSYLVTIKDSDSPVTIRGGWTFVFEPDVLSAGSITVSTPLSCFNGSDAELEANPTGGTVAVDYTYDWFKYDAGAWNPIGQTTKIATGIDQGLYRVYVNDDNFCGPDYVQFVFQKPPRNDSEIPPEIVFDSYDSKDECSGSADGTIDISASGGTGDIDYYLYGQTDGLYYPGGGAPPVIADEDGSFSGLIAQTYETYALDGNGCVVQGNDVVVSSVANPTASILPDPADACPSIPLAMDGNPTHGDGTSFVSHVWSGVDADSLDNKLIQTPNFTSQVVGVYNLTYTVTDDNGCSGSDNIVVNVDDAINPSITCIAPPTRDSDAGQCYYTVIGTEFDPTAVNDNCGVKSVTNDFNGTSTLAGEQITDGTVITWTVTDYNSNTANCNYTVTVNDNEDPSITCIVPPTRDSDAGQCYYTVIGAEFDPTSTSDNCGVASVINDFNGTNTLAGEQITDGTVITWTVTDLSANTSQCSYTVTVVDNEDPTITCIADPTRNTQPGQCYYQVPGPTFDPTSTGDNCGIASVNNDFNGLSTLAGEHITDGTVITWTVTDNSGNTGQCSFTVTVVDNENPTITCIANPTRDADAGQCYYTVSGTEFDPATATDNCSFTVTNDFNGLSTLAGEQITNGTTITWTITDGEGNTDNCSFTVTVNDNEDPSISCIANPTRDPDAGQCYYTVLGTEFDPTSTTDNCGIASVTNDFNGLSTLAGEQITDGTTIVWTITDNSANTAQCSFTVSVTDNEDPTITCIAPPTRNTDPGQCYYTVVGVEFDPTATNDNCGIASVTNDFNGLSTLAGEQITDGTVITWTITDNASNTAQCNYTVTVNDNENPSITCIAPPTRNVDAGQCYYTVVGTEFDPTSTSDNCGVASVINDFNGLSTLAGEQIPDGTVIIWTVTDNSSNTAQCNYTVSVTDNEDPAITCIAAPTRNPDPGQCYYTVVGTEFDPTLTSDNCGVASVVNDFNGLATLAGEQITNGTVITWTVTDNSANTAQCNYTVTVNDNEDPTITCIAPPTRNVDPGQCYYTVVGVEFDPTATSDNCGIASVVNDFNGLATLAGEQITDGTVITWTITDNASNTAQCSYTVTVVDNENPTITCIAPPTRNVDAGQCYYTVVGAEFDPTLTADNCSFTVTNDFNGLSTLAGEQITDGTVITWTITDGAANTAQCNYTVTVVDNENPTITCIADPTRNADSGQCYYTVSGTEFDPTLASDNCSFTVTNDFNGTATLAGEQITDGTVITWTITDGAANTAQCNYTVTVVDNQDPTITCPSDALVLQDGSCTAVVNGLAPTTNDNCGVTVQNWTMTGATVNAGAGDVSGETFNIGVTTVTYHIEDAAGNFTECSFDVEIYDVVYGGLIDADQTVCFNTTPAPFTDEDAATVCGGLTYQWQMKTGTGAWTDITGANAATYTELNPLTEITYYNRKATSDLGFGTAYSDTLTITIQPEPIADAGSDTTLCFDAVYQIQDADTSLSSGVTWEILTGNGSLDNTTIIDPEYTPAPNDAGTVVELVLHASGIAPCAESTDTVRLNYLSELLVSIGKPTPFFIDSTTTHIDVYVKISSHDFIGDIGVYLVSPLDSVVELKAGCFPTIPSNFSSDAVFRFYNDPLDTSAIAVMDKCDPSDGRYEFSGEWKKKLHNQDPANGAWRVRIVDYENWGVPGLFEEATIKFSDINNNSVFESILYADSSINKPITRKNLVLGPGVTDHTLPITGLTTSCFGVCDAKAVATASGGLAPYISYEWSDVIDFSTIYATGDTADLCAGTFYVRATDSNGCSAIDSITVGQPPEIYITEDTVVHNVCYGDTTGKVMLKFAGGTGALQYTYNGTDWYNSGDTIFNLGAAVYTFTIQDISGCTKDTIITINEPTAISITTNVTDNTCYGSDDGQIEILASGGTPGYTYSIDSSYTWDPGNIFGSLPEDTFYIAVQDAAGCIQFGDTIEMLYPDTITIDSVWVTPVICDGSADDGTITVFAHSSSGDLDYSINNGVDFYPDSLFTGLTGGAYQIVVQNPNGCTKTLDSLVTVNGPIVITYDSVVHNVCYGDTNGVIKLEFTGGTGALQYSHNGTDWYNSGDTIENLGAGVYTVSIMDVTGCSKDTIITINEPTPIVVSSTYTDNTCYGADNGQITITASGGTPGYTYSVDSAYTWDPGNIFNSLPQDTFYIAVQDAVGCIQFGDTIEMIYPDTISIDSIVAIPYSCFSANDDGEIIVYASGGVGTLEYSIDNVNFKTDSSFTGLIGGAYSIYVRDNCGTKMLDSTVSITGPIPITIDVVTINDVNTCYGDNTGDLSITASGGTGVFEYSINGGSSYQASNSFTGLSARSYVLSVRDDDGCTSPDSTVNISEPAELLFSSINVLHTSECNTPQNVGEITIYEAGGTPPYRYSLVRESDADSTTNSSGVFSGLQPDNYGLYVIDINGCTTARLDTSIVLNSAMQIDLDSVNITCYGLTNGMAYATIINGTPGAGSPGYIYSWTGPGTYSSSSDTIKNLKAGKYYLQIEDFNYPDPCISIDSVEVLQPDTLEVQFTVKDEFCITTEAIDPAAAKGRINAQGKGGTPGYKYLWTGPGVTGDTTYFLNNLDAGIYSLEIRDDNGCVVVKDTTVSENTDYEISSTGLVFDDYSVCWHDPVLFTATFSGNVDTLKLQAVDIEHSIALPVYYEVDNINPFRGEFTYMVGTTRFEIMTFYNDYCKSRIIANDTVEYIHSFGLEIVDTDEPENDTIIMKGVTHTQLMANVKEGLDLDFDWFYPSTEWFSDPIAQTTTLTPEESGWYGIAASSEEGCADTAFVYIDFIPAIYANEGFSPNGDGVNDYWKIKYIEKFPNNVVTIYNRWGGKVFEQKGYDNEDSTKSWDGTKNGKELPSGTYYYVIVLNEETFSPITGPITIIR